MNRINREVFISVADVLQGCRALTCGFGPAAHHTAEEFDWMVEFVMDNYFANVRLSTNHFLRKAAAMRIEETLAREALAYVTQEILLRIQRAFEVIFPNRSYTFVWVTETGNIRITESTALSPAEYCMTRSPTLQEPDDAYIPERLRRR